MLWYLPIIKLPQWQKDWKYILNVVLLPVPNHFYKSINNINKFKQAVREKLITEIGWSPNSNSRQYASIGSGDDFNYEYHSRDPVPCDKEHLHLKPPSYRGYN